MRSSVSAISQKLALRDLSLEGQQNSSGKFFFVVWCAKVKSKSAVEMQVRQKTEKQRKGERETS